MFSTPGPAHYPPSSATYAPTCYYRKPVFFKEASSAFQPWMVHRTKGNYFCYSNVFIILSELIVGLYISFYRQLDFSSEPGVADKILENEPKSCLTVA